MKPLKNLKHVKYTLTSALCCLAAVNGYAQLNYLSDSRSLSATATVFSQGAPWSVTSDSGPYSASATPSAPFTDFGASLTGNANLTEQLLQDNITYVDTHSAFVSASQTSFLHSQQLSYNSFEFGGGTIEGVGEGSSSLQVSFSVAAPISFDFTYEGLGDPLRSFNILTLSSTHQGVIVDGGTTALEQENQYGVPLDYSGTLLPGDVYTLTVSSFGGSAGANPSGGDGGGLLADLTVASTSPAVVPDTVPDSASTLTLLGTALCGLVAFQRRLGSLEV